MKKYYVQIPITGYLDVEIDAGDKESAIEKAFEIGTLEDLLEWEMHEQIIQGNVFHGLLNEVDIIEE